jgi:RimJ/RimL family protein N-acetyltransferase
MIVPPTLPFSLSQPLETERLILRMMTPADLDDLHSYWKLDEVAKYELYPPRTREENAERIAKYSSAVTIATDGDFWQLAVQLKPAGAETTGRVIGDLYFKLDSIRLSKAEIGWTVNPEYQGRGYATDAATAVMDVAFRTMGLHRVVAELDPENAASIALCKRLGMREEGWFVKDQIVKGEWGDSGFYGILETEWLEAHPA